MDQPEPEAEVELKSEVSKEVEAVVRKWVEVAMAPPTLAVSEWRRHRRASRQGRPGFILCSRLEPLAAAGAPGLLIVPSGDFPPGQCAGKEEAAREHVTTQEGEDSRELASPARRVLSPTLPAALESGSLLPNLSSNALLQAQYLVSDLTLP